LLEAIVSKLYQGTKHSRVSAKAGEQFVEFLPQQAVSSAIKSVAVLELALVKLKGPEHLIEYRIERPLLHFLSRRTFETKKNIR
jgi:hypothetical protein